LSRKNEIPFNFIFELEIFDIRGIDFAGPSLPLKVTNESMVAVDYISKLPMTLWWYSDFSRR